VDAHADLSIQEKCVTLAQMELGVLIMAVWVSELMIYGWRLFIGLNLFNIVQKLNKLCILSVFSTGMPQARMDGLTYGWMGE